MVPAKTRLLYLALVLTGAACGGGGPRRVDDPAIGGPVGMELPSADGDEVDLDRFRGRPLVVHVASTGSLDSQTDVEELRRSREAHPGLALAEIVFDDAGAAVAVPWANASGIDWSLLLPTPAVRKGDSSFGEIRVIPTTFLVDRDGRIAWRWEGALPRGRLSEAIRALDR
jgi:hypothetical protein